jgi:hypothetical protein
MDRRSLLQKTAAVGAIASVAGCLDTGGGDGTTTDPGTDEPTDTDAPTTSEPTTAEPTAAPIEITDQSIETTNAECGEENTASIEFKDAGATVTGTVRASTPCHLAEIANARILGDVLQLTVTATERDVDTCETCIGAISYTADVTTNRGPQSVVVIHEWGDGESDSVASDSR